MAGYCEKHKRLLIFGKETCEACQIANLKAQVEKLSKQRDITGDMLNNKIDEIKRLQAQVAELEAVKETFAEYIGIVTKKDMVIEVLARYHSPLNPQLAIDLAELEAKAKEGE